MIVSRSPFLQTGELLAQELGVALEFLRQRRPRFLEPPREFRVVAGALVVPVPQVAAQIVDCARRAICGRLGAGVGRLVGTLVHIRDLLRERHDFVGGLGRIETLQTLRALGELGRTLAERDQRVHLAPALRLEVEVVQLAGDLIAQQDPIDPALAIERAEVERVELGAALELPRAQTLRTPRRALDRPEALQCVAVGLVALDQRAHVARWTRSDLWDRLGLGGAAREARQRARAHQDGANDARERNSDRHGAKRAPRARPLQARQAALTPARFVAARSTHG
jgi:hypothetical protein